MNVYASVCFYPVNQEIMNRICENGLKTSPEFFSRYNDEFYKPRTNKKSFQATSIRLFAEHEEDVFSEVHELLSKSRGTFLAMLSKDIHFTVDIGFLEFQEMDTWLQEKGSFSIVIHADFWSVLAPFQGNFSLTFFCAPPEQPPDELEEGYETQFILENHWFRKSFLHGKKLTKGFLHIHHLDEQKFPVFSSDWKLTEGEYRLPFPERLDWYDVGETMYRTLAEWESLFLEIKNSGAELELSISLPREEQAKFLRSQFGLNADWIQILHRLEIPLKFTIVRDS